MAEQIGLLLIFFQKILHNIMLHSAISLLALWYKVWQAPSTTVTLIECDFMSMTQQEHMCNDKSTFL